MNNEKKDIDYWFNNKIWSKINNKYATPHLFFCIGFATALILILSAILLIKILNIY